MSARADAPDAPRRLGRARSRLLAPRQATTSVLLAGNSIGFLQFALAALVITHHTRVLGGFGPDFVARLMRDQADLGVLAVAGFFVLSGFLITRSASGVSLPRYLWHRCLRVLPAFWVCLLAMAFILGPILWLVDTPSASGGLAGYLASRPSPLDFVLNNAALLIQQTHVDGLLAANPYPAALNGSLWTLAYEFAWYLVVALFAGFGLLRRPLPVVALIGYVFLTNVVHAQPLADVPVIGYALLSRFGLAFSVGMLAWVYRDRVPLDDRIAVVAVAVMLTTLRVGGFSPFGMTAYAYLVLWGAWRIPLYRFGRRTDVSYGLYIYAFPVQQTIAAILPGLTPVAFLVASFAGTLPLAWLSYRLVEAPALRLKNVRVALPRRRPAVETEAGTG